MQRICSTAVTAFFILGALAACGSDDVATADEPEGQATSSEAAAAEAADGRAFDSTDDAIVQALTAALNAEKVEIDGDRVAVHLGNGSVSDPTAGLHCTTITELIGDGELGFIVYPDGEYDCRDRR